VYSSLLVVPQADVTATLRSTHYWASFNRPYFREVYLAMGYGELNATYGEQYPYLFGYDNYFRAELFRREQPKVQTLADMQRVMMLNQWQTDPFSYNNSGFAIASKISQQRWMVNDVTNNEKDVMRVSTISGPTHVDQPVFSWTDPEWAGESHLGLPDTYDFVFLQLSLGSNPPASDGSACDDHHCGTGQECKLHDNGLPYCTTSASAIVGAVLGSFSFLVLVLVGVCWYRKRQRRELEEVRLANSYNAAPSDSASGGTYQQV
jgi:hypothetical protein